MNWISLSERPAVRGRGHEGTFSGLTEDENIVLANDSWSMTTLPFQTRCQRSRYCAEQDQWAGKLQCLDYGGGALPGECDIQRLLAKEATSNPSLVGGTETASVRCGDEGSFGEATLTPWDMGASAGCWRDLHGGESQTGC